MSNEKIAEINETQVTNKQEAVKLLGISDPSPSVSDTVQAFKKLALLIHPDKNPDNKEAATAAFKKLSTAKEYALSGSTSGNSFHPSQTNVNDTFSNLFDPEGAFMKGPIVRKARDIILTWARCFDRHVDTQKAQEIRSFFSTFELGEDPAAKKDKAELFLHVALLFPDGDASSDNVARQFHSKNLTDNILFLSSLATRYPKLRENYQVAFKSRIVTLLQNTATSLQGIAANFNGELKEENTLTFNSFMQFAYAFSGSKEKADNGTLTIPDPAIQDALTLLDNCVSENPALFSNLVRTANLIRSQLDPDEPFLYSETSLENNPEKAKQINSLCGGQTKLGVFNAQLSYVIQLILGSQFNPTVPETLQNRFPTQDNIFAFEHSFETGESLYKFTNIFTKEVITEKPRRHHDPLTSNPENHIKPVIPNKIVKNQSAIDAYKEYYSTCDGISFTENLDGKVDSEGYETTGILKNPILPILKETWSNSPVKEPQLTKNAEDEKPVHLPPTLVQPLPQPNNPESKQVPSGKNEATVVVLPKNADLLKRLQRYIDRIDSYNKYSHGFWFFSLSRGINREANYLLAKKLLDNLNKNLGIASVFSDIDSKRTQIIKDNKLDSDPNYTERGINSSELNAIIRMAIKRP